MAIFVYNAKNEHGESLKGKVEAKTQQQAVQLLQERAIVVVNLRPVEKSFFSGALSTLSSIKFTDVVNFTGQLSTMITAGLPLVEALHILQSQTEKPAMVKLLGQLLRDLEGGSTFAESLEKHPKTFNTTYVQLVKAGEIGGILDEVLQRLAKNMEDSKEFRAKVKGAMIYPVIVFLGMLVAMAIMMIVVVPKMTEMYDDLGAELPIATQVLIDISDFMVQFWYLIAAFLVVMGIVFRQWVKTERGSLIFDKFLFKVPIIGLLRSKTILTEYARTFSLLLGAGVSLLRSLKIVSNSMDSVLYRQTMTEIQNRVEKGIALSEAMGRYELFPAILTQMTAVGEETGKLDEVMLKLSAYFQSESESAVKNLTSAMEPIIIVVLAIGVGFIIMAVVLPIYNLTNEF